MKNACLLALNLLCATAVHASPAVEYHPNGNKKAEITEHNGAQYAKYYDEEGNLTAQGELKNGKNSGKWEYFDKTGKRVFVKHYLNGHIIAEGLGDRE